MKTLIFLLTILIFVLVQSACGNGNQPAPTATVTKPNTGDRKSATGTPVPLDTSIPATSSSIKDENVVITFASYEFDRAFFEPLMDAFHQENSSITVQFVPLAFPSSNPSVSAKDAERVYLRTLASSADVTFVSGRSMLLGSYFRDLQPQIDSDPSFKADDFWSDALTACQDTQGRILGIPMNLFFSGIFYDEQAFTAAGLATPQPGWTWDDFRKDAAALSKRDGGHYGYGDPTYTSVTSPLIFASLEKTGGEIDVQALSQDLGWYVDLAKTKVIYPIQGKAGNDTAQPADKRWMALFQENHPPAMWFGRLQEPIPGLAGVSEDNDPATHLAITRFGIVPLPVEAGNTNEKSTPFSAQCAAVSAGSTHPRAAWSWINFLSQHWLIRDRQLASELAQIPSRKSVAEKVGFWKSLPSSAQASVRFGLEHAWFTGLYSSSENAILGALEKAASGKMALTDALNEAKAMVAAQPQLSPDTNPVIVATPRASLDHASSAAVIQFYFGSATAPEYETAKALVERFNQEHSADMVVNLSSANNSSAGEGYYQSLANEFDCFSSQIDPVGAASSNVVLKLNTLFEGEDQTFRKDFNPVLLDASRSQGDLYDLPFTSQPPIMVYNADLLAKHGLKIPSNDWTFDDFINLATSITSKQANISGFITAGQTTDTIGMLYAGRNVQWLNKTGEIPLAKFDSPQMAETLVWLSQLYQSGVLFQAAEGADWWQSMSDAVQGNQVAFWTALAGQQKTEYFDTKEPSFHIGIAPLPVVSLIGAAIASSFDRGLYISRVSKNPQACWTWIKYLSVQPSGFNGVPSRTSVANSPAWEAGVGKENATVYRLAVSRIQRLVGGKRANYLKLPLITWKGQAEIDVQKGMNSRQALTQAQRKADAYQACISANDLTKLSDSELENKVIACAKQVDPSWQ